MERLAASDLVMLRPDEVGWPMDIGALAILDGSQLVTDDGTARVNVVREAIERHLHLVPRFRQRLYNPPLGLGWPLWVDASDFDIAEHIRVQPLVATADEAQLLRAVEHLRNRRLDRSRPLWEMWLLPGLSEGHVGMFIKMHHAIADGVAGVATIGALLDQDANALPDAAPPWTPAPMPSSRELFADNIRRRLSAAGEAVRTLAHPSSAVRRARRTTPAVSASMAMHQESKTSLVHRTGRRRQLTLIRGDLHEVKHSAHMYGVKLNDVLLTAVAEGLRRLLLSRGESVQNVVLSAYVPASLHQEQAGQAAGNVTGMMFVPLPIGEPDPKRRLASIATVTSERKQHIVRPPSGVLARNAVAQRAFLRLAMHRRFADIYVANVPGPSTPLYLAGARLLEVFPVVPLAGTMTIAVGALTYPAQFNITVVSNPDACPDVDVFTNAVRDALQAVASSTTPA
jgi:diacylglycerol O-acyltransferase / wax synthase